MTRRRVTLKTNKKWKNREMETILVAGATGGVGKRVVRHLLANNYRVRALVRDANKARALLGDSVELFEGDITIPETLSSQLMAGVSAVICCIGVRVQPVEGDTEKREKYYQGIKFYLPEVVDSPEMVEYQGVKNLIEIAKNYLGLEENLLIKSSSPPTPQWIMVSSAGVTRPGRSGINLEEEPPAVRLNDQLGGILTWKLRGEEVVRSSGLPYTIIRPCALTEKPGDKLLVFDQGDTIKGQVSRERIAALCVQLLTLPQGCHKTFEVREEMETGSWLNLKEQLANLQPDS
ncbi:MAG: SDR family oxidoreductase [Spirulina sp.]